MVKSPQIKVSARVTRDGCDVRYEGGEQEFGRVASDLSVIQCSIPMSDRSRVAITESEHRLRLGLGFFCLVFALFVVVIAGGKK